MSASKKKPTSHTFNMSNTARILESEFGDKEVPSKVVEFIDSLVGIYATLLHA